MAFSKLEWQRCKRKEFRDRHGYSDASHYATGGLREFILRRDNYACVKCGMTDMEHKAKWGRPITIDHKDKNRQNNTPENLQTLCLSCHGRKDLIPRLREKKFNQAQLWELYVMHRVGFTYEEIGQQFGANQTTVHKWFHIIQRKFDEYGISFDFTAPTEFAR